MNYGNILSSAWKTVWKHKVIFWFGLLMAVPQVFMGIVMGAIFYFFSDEYFSIFFGRNLDDPNAFMIFFAVFFVGMTLFSFITYIVMALSFAGTLKGTLDLRDQEVTISFGELWKASLPFMWRIFGLFFVIFAGLFLLFLIMMLFFGLVSAVTAGFGALCMMPLFFLILPVEFLVLIFASVAMVVIVVENIGVFDAMRRAMDIFKQNFWSLILMGIIVAVIIWGVSMVAMVPMQMVQFSYMMPMMVDPYTQMQDPTAFFRLYAIMMAIMMPLIGISQGLSFSYMNAVWVYTYLDITDKAENDEGIIE